MLSKGKKKILEAIGHSVLIKYVFYQHESLCTHSFIQQILINKHIPGFVQGPRGLEDERTPAQLLLGLQCNTRDRHAEHFLQYSELPPQRYLQDTENLANGKIICLEKSGQHRGQGSHRAATYP